MNPNLSGTPENIGSKILFYHRPVGGSLGALLMLVLALASGGLATLSPDHANASPPPDWLEWQHARQESIAGTNGWTTLVARYWLPEGRTLAGADPTNQLILPAGHAPAAAGVFSREGKSVRFEAGPGVVATVDGIAVHELAQSIAELVGFRGDFVCDKSQPGGPAAASTQAARGRSSPGAPARRSAMG